MNASAITISYVRHALITALRVARFEPNVIAEYDQSFEGFFRSFWALPLCAPFYVLVELSERKIGIEAAVSRGELAFGAPVAGSFGFYLIEAAAYVVDWLALPIAMIAVVRLLGVTARYVPFVVAYNWGTCVVMAVTLPPHLLYLMGIISLKGVALLYYPVTIFALVYRWRVAREALEVPGLTATGVVVIDVLLSIFVAFGAAQLQGGM